MEKHEVCYYKTLHYMLTKSSKSASSPKHFVMERSQIDISANVIDTGLPLVTLTLPCKQFRIPTILKKENLT